MNRDIIREMTEITCPNCGATVIPQIVNVLSGPVRVCPICGKAINRGATKWLPSWIWLPVVLVMVAIFWFLFTR